MRNAPLLVFLMTFFSVNHVMSQTRIWTVSDTSQPNSVVAKLALDGSGNVLVGLQGTNIAAVEKLDSTRATKWLAAFHGNFDVAFQDMIADAAGNSYMCGNVRSASNGNDALIVKINPLGTIQWSPTLDYKHGYDNYNAMTFDGIGNIIAIGTASDSIGNGQVVVTKYTPAGTVIWSSQHGAPNFNYQGQKVMLDASGNIYVASARQSLSSGYDFNVAKFDSNGNFLWEQSFNSTGISNDIPTSVAVDNGGNVYLVGHGDSSNVYFGFLAKVDASGTARWTQILRHGFTEFNACAIDGGNLYVAGGSDTDGALVVKIDTANGNTLWSYHFTASGILGGAINSIVYKNGSLYTTGNVIDSVAGPKLLTMKVSGDGHLLYSDIYYGAGTSFGNDYGAGIAVGNDGNFYVGGNTNESNSGPTSATVLRYYETPTGIFEMADNKFTVSAFPNPTATQLQFTFDMPNAGHAAMSIYDINGKEITTVFDQHMESGKNNVQWSAESLAKGTYLYEVVTPTGKSSGKFIKF